MGPLQLADFIGLDVCLSILRVLRGARQPQIRTVPAVGQHGHGQSRRQERPRVLCAHPRQQRLGGGAQLPLFSDIQDMKGSRERLHEIIFEADTPAGKRFGVLLRWLIVAA